MTPLQFEARHAPTWVALETALDDAAQRRWTRHRSASDRSTDAADLALRYRLVCGHLALARARAYPLRLVARLDGLAQRAHARIYRRNDYGVARLARLFLIDFPVAVRAQRRHVLVAAVVFGLPLVLLGIATDLDPGIILSSHDLASVQRYADMYGPASASIGQRASDTEGMMFGYYIRNNIGIAFQCYAGGILFGLGSLFFLAHNGMLAGSLAGFLTAAGLGPSFYPFVVTHGAFELTAIVLSGSAGLRLGQALLAPGRSTRRAALERAAAESVVVVYGVTAMLLIAAAIEAFWSSARGIAPGLKYAVGGACWAFVFAYLGWQGRPRDAA
ncbi:MAG: stage II sporulation protein M [Pseudomonadota bacterium]|nr:stage II sporulation protein M [Pseudomonadota bacterium]